MRKKTFKKATRIHLNYVQ